MYLRAVFLQASPPPTPPPPPPSPTLPPPPQLLPLLAKLLLTWCLLRRMSRQLGRRYAAARRAKRKRWHVVGELQLTGSFETPAASAPWPRSRINPARGQPLAFGLPSSPHGHARSCTSAREARPYHCSTLAVTTRMSADILLGYFAPSRRRTVGGAMVLAPASVGLSLAMSVSLGGRLPPLRRVLTRAAPSGWLARGSVTCASRRDTNLRPSASKSRELPPPALLPRRASLDMGRSTTPTRAPSTPASEPTPISSSRPRSLRLNGGGGSRSPPSDEPDVVTSLTACERFWRCRDHRRKMLTIVALHRVSRADVTCLEGPALAQLASDLLWPGALTWFNGVADRPAELMSFPALRRACTLLNLQRALRLLDVCHPAPPLPTLVSGCDEEGCTVIAVIASLASPEDRCAAVARHRLGLTPGEALRAVADCAAYTCDVLLGRTVDTDALMCALRLSGGAEGVECSCVTAAPSVDPTLDVLPFDLHERLSRGAAPPPTPPSTIHEVDAASRGAVTGGGAARAAISCASWNAQGLNAPGRPKMAWLSGWLVEHSPAVLFVQEVHGTLVDFRHLRSWLRRRGYDARFLPGADTRRRTGVLAAVRVDAGRITGYERVATRALGLRVRMHGELDDRFFCGMHGISSVNGSAFCLQLRAAEAYARRGVSGLVVGDFNHVPCRSWRCGFDQLSKGDLAMRKLAGWSCGCCDGLAPPDEHTSACIVPSADDSLSGWTRFHTGGGVLGDGTSRIDYAVGFPREHRWACRAVDIATVSDTNAPLSDHAVVLFDCPANVTAACRDTRPSAPRLNATDSAELTRRLRDGGEAHESLLRDVANARRRDLPAADVVVRVVNAEREAIADARREELREHRRLCQRSLRGRTSAERELSSWRAFLRQAIAARNAGVSAFAASMTMPSGVLHPRSGLRRYRGGGGNGWAGVIRRCRHEMRRVAAIVQRRRDQEQRRCVKIAKQIGELPEDDHVSRLRLAQAILRGPRQSAAMDEVRVGDVESGRRVKCTDNDAGQVLADNGAAMVAAFDDGAVPEAYAAMCDKFVGQWPTLCGLDGGVFDLRKSLSFGTFRRIVRGLKPKAVGTSGFAAALLKSAGEGVLKSCYNAIVGDILRDTISDRWHEVLYVLLVKPSPNRPHIMRERREIALTEQDVKVMLHVLRRACYARVIGRVSHLQIGWVPGLSCTDPGMASGWLVQQARRLKVAIYLLYADLSSFFSRIERQCLRIADLAHGLPVECVRVALAVYGMRSSDPRVARCRYDSSGGLSDPFINGIGSLMGCPLSTDEARLFLDCLVRAIHAVGKGMRLWGSSSEDGEHRRVLQLLCCDDWLGVCVGESELQAVWAVWRLWEPMSNCKIGIKAAAGTKWMAVGRARPRCGKELHCEALALAIRHRRTLTAAEWAACRVPNLTFGSFIAVEGVYYKPAPDGDKTIVTGVRYDEHGRPVDIADPGLRTVDGRLVPVRGTLEAYKHLGRFRCANGDCRRGLKEFKAKIGAAVRKLWRVRFTSRRAFMLVSDALIGGSAGFHLQELYLSFNEADKLEAKWRAAYNAVAQRTQSTPRAEIYTSKPVAGRTRRHLWAHGLVALFNAVNSAMSDVHDTEHRAAARAGLALSLYSWGCRQPPRTWQWTHLRSELEAALADSKVRYIGDAWMLARLVICGADTKCDDDLASTEAAREEAWRWPCPPHIGDPLSDSAAHWRPSSTPSLTSMKIQVDREILSAGCVALGHFCCSALGGGARWMTYREALRRHPYLRKATRVQRAWDRCVAAAKLVSQPSPPEASRSASHVWREGHTLSLSPITRPPSPPRANTDALLALGDELQLVRSRRFVRSQRYWRSQLDAAIPSDPPVLQEWSHGVVASGDRARCAHVVCDITGDGIVSADGGEARWLSRHEVCEDGVAEDWRSVMMEWSARLDIDGAGYVTCDGARVLESQLCELPTAVQLLARARYTLPDDVPVVDHPTTAVHKADTTRVNLTAMRESLAAAISLQARYRFTHAYATDATRADKEGKEGPYVVIARSALRQDGLVLGGRITDEDPYVGVHNTTYLGEKAATDDAICNANADGEGARVLLWIDSISHVQALRSFARAPARRKQTFHAGGRHAATLAALESPEVVCYHWQRSHVGCSGSEAADKLADQAAEDEVVDELLPSITNFASMIFPRDQVSSRGWTGRRCDAAVAAHLRTFTQRTVFVEASDVPLKTLPEADELVLAEVRADRCFHSDQGLHLAPFVRSRRAALTCPWGCDAACTWEHFCFECEDVDMVEARRTAYGYAQRLYNVTSDAAPNDALKPTLDWLHDGDYAVRQQRGLPGWPAMRATSDAARNSGLLRGARRVAGGAIDANNVQVTREVRMRATLLASSFAALLRAARSKCQSEYSGDIRTLNLAYRVFLRYARRLRARVASGGPKRAATLGYCASLEQRVLARVGHSGAASAGWVGHRRLLVRAAHAIEGDGDSARTSLVWFILARVCRWRLRTWRWLPRPRLCAVGPGAGPAARAAELRTWRAHGGRESLRLPWCNADTSASELVGSWVAPEVLSRRALVARAASAQLRSLKGRRKPKVASRVESAQLAAAAGAQAIASWLTSGTVHGGPPCNSIPAFAITIEAVARRPADAARKRVRAAAGRRIERGQQADDNDCWQVERLLDVRQRPQRAGKRQSSAIDALLLWAGTWGGAQDWTPVNKAWMPDANLRRQAHAMWAARKRQAAGLPSCDGGSDGGACSDEHSDSDVQQVAGSGAKRTRDDADDAEPIYAVTGLVEQGDDGIVAASEGDEGGDSDAAGDTDDDDDDDCVPVEGVQLDPVTAQHVRDDRAIAMLGYAQLCKRRDATNQQEVLPFIAQACRSYNKANALLHASDPLRAGRAMLHGVCATCGTAGRGVLCVPCVSKSLLSTSSPHAALLTAVDRLCAAPTLETLSEVMSCVNVRGDGSCWSYALLAPFGLAPHVATANGLPCCANDATRAPLRVGTVDRAHDRELRRRLVAWFRTHDPHGARFCGGGDTFGEHLANIEERLPTYSALGVCTALGKFGGDSEFCAAADVLQCVIFAFDIHDHGDCMGKRFERGARTVEGARGGWISSTLSATLEFCAVSDAPLLVLRHEPAHWRVMLPIRGDGRVMWRAPLITFP